MTNKSNKNLFGAPHELQLLLMLVVTAVVLISVALSQCFQGMPFFVLTGVLLVAANAAVYLLTYRTSDNYALMEKGIAEFEKDHSCRISDKCTDPSAQVLNLAFDQIEADEKYSRELIHNISHEIRTPLTSLKLTVEAVQDGIYTLDQETISNIDNDIKRVDSTVTAMQRHVAITDPVDNANCDISHILVETAQRTRRISPTTDVKLKATPDPQWNTTVNITADQAHALLDAIVSNALEHAEGMTTIEITLSMLTQQHTGHSIIKVSIANDGRGTTLTQSEMIQPFHKEDVSHTLKGAGQAGLGLTTAEKIVHLANGTMRITSKPETGTCVSLFFPTSQDIQI